MFSASAFAFGLECELWIIVLKLRDRLIELGRVFADQLQSICERISFFFQEGPEGFESFIFIPPFESPNTAVYHRLHDGSYDKEIHPPQSSIACRRKSNPREKHRDLLTQPR